MAPRGAARGSVREGPTSRQLSSSLVSVAGLVDRPVSDQRGDVIGKLVDVVIRSDPGHPRVTGYVVAIGRRRAWLHSRDVGGLDQAQLISVSTRFDLSDVVRRPGEIQLVADVIDHQLLDLNGARVVRASDLYLAKPVDTWHLVAVDVSWVSFLRRALPGMRGRRPSPSQVLDWAVIQPFEREGGLHLSADHAALRRLRPGELADLLEDLGRVERRALLDTLEVDVAADALEEMEPAQLAGLLRDAPAAQAAELIAEMERDEGAEALRGLAAEERADILAAMGPADADELRDLLQYEEDTAGGTMTSDVVIVDAASTVAQTIAMLRAAPGSPTAVAVVDADGRLLDDVTVLELLGVAPSTPIADLMGPPWPVTVTPHDDLEELVEVFVENRGSTIFVVDDDGRPVGQIMGDDIVDALRDEDERRWPWQRHLGMPS